jgi:DNA-binding transcriptional regulator GbsR (MarR family)
MAHIHALLMFECHPLCADEIMKQLEISRGNVNMNLRLLVSWELIHGTNKEGDRKEYFYAEKDMWKIFSKIVLKRKEQELIPLLNMLNELSECTHCRCEEEAKFQDTISEMKTFAVKADGMLETMCSSDSSWLVKGFKMMIGK